MNTMSFFAGRVAVPWLIMSLMALAFSSLACQMSARADVLTTRTVETTTNPDGTSTVVTTTSDSASVSPGTVTLVSPSTVYSLLDSRRFELDRLIASRLVNGQMTPGQALKLRTQLDDIAAQISAARLSGYSAVDPHVITLGKQLDAVSLEAAGILSITPLTPITIVDTTTGDTRIAIDAFGNIVAISTLQPTVYSTTLDARRDELRKLIASGEATGTIPRAQADSFRLELDRLTALENAALAAGLSPTNALPIAMQLDTLRERVITYSPAVTIQPLIVGSRFILTNNQVALLDDIMVRRADLEGRIASQLAVGKISERQAASLRAQLDESAVLERAMRSDGNLNFNESRQLYTAFDKVATRLDGYIAKD
jgi:hypothetical protein